jgi:hypothetical protein
MADDKNKKGERDRSRVTYLTKYYQKQGSAREKESENQSYLLFAPLSLL